MWKVSGLLGLFAVSVRSATGVDVDCEACADQIASCEAETEGYCAAIVNNVFDTVPSCSYITFDALESFQSDLCLQMTTSDADPCATSTEYEATIDCITEQNCRVYLDYSEDDYEMPSSTEDYDTSTTMDYSDYGDMTTTMGYDYDCNCTQTATEDCFADTVCGTFLMTFFMNQPTTTAGGNGEGDDDEGLEILAGIHEYCDDETLDCSVLYDLFECSSMCDDDGGDDDDDDCLDQTVMMNCLIDPTCYDAYMNQLGPLFEEESDGLVITPYGLEQMLEDYCETEAYQDCDNSPFGLLITSLVDDCMGDDCVLNTCGEEIQACLDADGCKEELDAFTFALESAPSLETIIYTGYCDSIDGCDPLLEAAWQCVDASCGDDYDDSEEEQRACADACDTSVTNCENDAECTDLVYRLAVQNVVAQQAMEVAYQLAEQCIYTAFDDSQECMDAFGNCWSVWSAAEALESDHPWDQYNVACGAYDEQPITTCAALCESCEMDDSDDDDSDVWENAFNDDSNPRTYRALFACITNCFEGEDVIEVESTETPTTTDVDSESTLGGDDDGKASTVYSMVSAVFGLVALYAVM